MKTIRLSDLNIFDIGNTIQISGVLFSGNDNDYLCFFPDEGKNPQERLLLDMDYEDWKKFIAQTDLLETEMFLKDEKGILTKIVVRKSTRQIEQGLSWKVFERDNYTCRYCGKTGIPLTVDHIVLWEKGGPTIEENLLTACRKCNKTRGNMEYRDWLKSLYYLRASAAGVGPAVQLANIAVLSDIKDIPLRVHIKSR